MQKFIPVDKLARPDNFVQLRGRRAREIREEQGLACDVFDQIIRIAQRNGDDVIERAVDYVLADEITHVRMGSKWMRKLTEGDPERLARALAFQESIDESFNFRGLRRGEEDIR